MKKRPPTRKQIEAVNKAAVSRLGQQAAIASSFTGISLDFCSKMVLHRVVRQVKKVAESL